MILIHPLKGSVQSTTDNKRIHINYKFAELLQKYLQEKGDTAKITRSSESALVGNLDSMSRQYDTVLTVTIDCYADLAASLSGYHIICDHYSALVGTWNHELYALGRRPVRTAPLGYTANNKLEYGKAQDIKLYLGYVSNKAELEYLSNDDNLETMVKRLVEGSYGPPLYSLNDTDPTYNEDPYFYKYDVWKEVSPVSGCSGLRKSTTYNGLPINYLELTSKSNVESYTWETPILHNVPKDVYVLSTVKVDGNAYPVVKVKCLDTNEYLLDTVVDIDARGVFKTITNMSKVDANCVLELGIKGTGTIAYTGIWIAPVGSLGSLDDPRVQYSPYPPGYRPSKISTYVRGNTFDAVLTTESTLLGRMSDAGNGSVYVNPNEQPGTVSIANPVESRSGVDSFEEEPSVKPVSSSSSKSSSSSSKSILTTAVSSVAAVAALNAYIKNSSKLASMLKKNKKEVLTQDTSEQEGKEVVVNGKTVVEKGSSVTESAEVADKDASTTNAYSDKAAKKIIADDMKSQGDSVKDAAETKEEQVENAKEAMKSGHKNVLKSMQEATKKDLNFQAKANKKWGSILGVAGLLATFASSKKMLSNSVSVATTVTESSFQTAMAAYTTAYENSNLVKTGDNRPTKEQNTETTTNTETGASATVVKPEYIAYEEAEAGLKEAMTSGGTDSVLSKLAKNKAEFTKELDTYKQNNKEAEENRQSQVDEIAKDYNSSTGNPEVDSVMSDLKIESSDVDTKPLFANEDLKDFDGLKKGLAAIDLSAVDNNYNVDASKLDVHTVYKSLIASGIVDKNGHMGDEDSKSGTLTKLTGKKDSDSGSFSVDAAMGIVFAAVAGKRVPPPKAHKVKGAAASAVDSAQISKDSSVPTSVTAKARADYYKDLANKNEEISVPVKDSVYVNGEKAEAAKVAADKQLDNVAKKATSAGADKISAKEGITKNISATNAEADKAKATVDSAKSKSKNLMASISNKLSSAYASTQNMVAKLMASITTKK